MRQSTAAILVFAGSVAVGSAQEQTASIVGVVRDSSGGVTPGATVVARAAGGLTVETTTDGVGRYRFPSVPPGSFDITATLTGFAPARVEGVDLRLGQQLSADITLEHAALSETIRVVAESPTIAITQSARATSLRQEDIEKLPNGREFTDVVNQVGGANIETNRFTGNISIDGASGAENRFLIDGAETTDLVFGTATTFNERAIVADFMEEIQVKSSGYTAEFGGATGGVILREGTCKFALSPDERHVFTGCWEGSRHWTQEGTEGRAAEALPLVRIDLATGAVEPQEQYFESGELMNPIALDPSGTRVITGAGNGTVRVRPVAGGPEHLLLGHEGLVWDVAVSPDGRSIASAGMDGTVRLWPMPEGRPFHKLPYDEVLDRIRALTNLRVVDDENSTTGYRVEVGPFPGWETVPTW